MALEGIFSGKTSNSRIKPTITWSAVQSVVGNYSDITAKLTYRRNNNYTTEGSWEGSLTIGEQVFTGKRHIEITDDADAEAITATARVQHDDYGALKVEVSATGGIVSPSSSTLKTTEISGEITLDTIARASTVSAANADIGSRSTVVVARKNSSFTHSIAYRFGELSGYIDADGNPTATEQRLSATTLNFLLPESFYDQIPDSPTGKCTLICRTYSSDTRIGEDQTANFTVTAAQSLCAPELDYDVSAADELTEWVTGSRYTFVPYVSAALCRIRATANHGASIVETTIDGVAGQERTIENIQTDKITFQAKDSRGYITTYTAELNMVPYIPLTNNATVQRTDPTSGGAVLTLTGTCWNGHFGRLGNDPNYSFSVNGGSLYYDHLAAGEDHKYWEQIKLTGLDYTKNHKIEVTISDLVMSVTKTLTVQKGIPVFDWGEEDFRFNVPVECPGLTINGQSLEDYIRTVIQNG